MQDFSKFNKKRRICKFTTMQISKLVKKLNLVANLSVYEPGEAFTVVNESTPTFSTSTPELLGTLFGGQ
jgi:hypothetical protein